MTCRRRPVRGPAPRPVRGPVRGPARRTDDGSASLYVLWLCVVLAAVGGAILTGGRALVTRARTQAAADLAALAAAGHGYAGTEAACERARRVAERNGARLAACRFDGAEVTVVAEAELPGFLRPTGPVRVEARAGPVDAGLPRHHLVSRQRRSEARSPPGTGSGRGLRVRRSHEMPVL